MTVGPPSQGVRGLRAALRRTGGTVAEVLLDDQRLPAAAARPGPAQVAAAGPRARGQEAEYELLLEMIYEGSLLHYARPRVLEAAESDLALLLGDQLYALGLSRLAALGDVEAVGELSDVISLLAQAHVRADPGLADAVWGAGAVAVGWGPDSRLLHAKALARDQHPGAAAALNEVAASRSGNKWSADACGSVDGNLYEALNQPPDR